MDSRLQRWVAGSGQSCILVWLSTCYATLAVSGLARTGWTKITLYVVCSWQSAFNQEYW